MLLSGKIRILIFTVLFCFAFIVAAYPSMAAVPIRISIKFILDANGNRPATGRLNTDAEIWNEINQGISILRDVRTEFTIDTVEFVDLTGLSQWYTTASDDNQGFSDLRSAAMANPATYHWRTDALNIYINGGNKSAASLMPPDNDYILMNQGCGNNPSCILHEMGHSLSLLHTFDGCGSTHGCPDTLHDDVTWTSKDQMAMDSFGTTFANLTAAQQDLVNLTWNNIMSYHVDEPQRRIGPLQMNNMSKQGYEDKRRLYSKGVIYVNWNGSLMGLGSFLFPYQSFQDALNNASTGCVFVLEGVNLTADIGAFLNADAEIITRSGPSEVHAHGFQSYKLPVDLANSANPQVSSAVRSAQNEDTNARVVVKNAETAAASAASQDEKDAILIDAKKMSIRHLNNAITHLQSAENAATGDEKLAIQLELAQRYRDSYDCAAAIRYFRLVAEATDQPGLKVEATREADRCEQQLITPSRPEAPVITK